MDVSVRFLTAAHAWAIAEHAALQRISPTKIDIRARQGTAAPQPSNAEFPSGPAVPAFPCPTPRPTPPRDLADQARRRPELTSSQARYCVAACFGGSPPVRLTVGQARHHTSMGCGARIELVGLDHHGVPRAGLLVAAGAPWSVEPEDLTTHVASPCREAPASRQRSFGSSTCAFSRQR